MGFYEIGINEAPLTERQKLDAAIATYRSTGDYDKANKLEAVRQKLDLAKPQEKVATRTKKKVAKKKGPTGIVIPGEPTVYRTSGSVPVGALVGIAAIGSMLIYAFKRSS